MYFGRVTLVVLRAGGGGWTKSIREMYNMGIVAWLVLLQIKGKRSFHEKMEVASLFCHQVVKIWHTETCFFVPRLVSKYTF